MATDLDALAVLQTISDAAIELIKGFEGLQLRAYKCSSGMWTIGYGHTAAAGPPSVTEGMKISEEEADSIFASDIEKVASELAKRITVDLNPNQFGALVSLAYNCGVGRIAASTAVRQANDGNFDEVPNRIKLWNKARHPTTNTMVELPGLTRRREAEARLWATPC